MAKSSRSLSLGRWAAGLGLLAMVLATGCRRPASQVVEQPPQEKPMAAAPEAKTTPLASLTEAATLLPQVPALGSGLPPKVLPLAKVPMPNVASTDELREPQEDGARVVRQVKRFADGNIINHGHYAEYRADGSKYCEGEYVDGQRSGPWKFWYAPPKSGGEPRLAKSGAYKAGKPDGRWTYYLEEGPKDHVEDYLEGKRHGRWLYYGPSDRVSRQEEYQAGKPHGTWIEYYPDNLKHIESHLVDGELDGEQTVWHRNGKKAGTGQFKNGRRDGTFITYNEQGGPVSEMIYRNDLLVRIKE